MSGALSSVKEVLARCRQLSRPLVIAIDGRCAAGKTTLAAALQRETGCTVLHLDHFFLRPEQRTPQRLAQPGDLILTVGAGDIFKVGEKLASLH